MFRGETKKSNSFVAREVDHIRHRIAPLGSSLLWGESSGTPRGAAAPVTCHGDDGAEHGGIVVRYSVLLAHFLLNRSDIMPLAFSGSDARVQISETQRNSGIVRIPQRTFQGFPALSSCFTNSMYITGQAAFRAVLVGLQGYLGAHALNLPCREIP